METKGFTLVELLAVIIILSLLALIAGTAITKTVKDAKGDLTTVQISLIESAAKTWGAENLDKLPDSNECVYIILGDLKKYGLLESSVVNFNTNDEIPDSTKIKISASTNSYKTIYNYEVNPESVDSCEEIKMFYTVYRNSTDVIEIGESIKPGIKNVWCVVYSNGNETCGNNGGIGWEEEECLSRASAYTNATCREKIIQTGLTPGSYYTEEDKEDITSDVYLKLEIGNGVVAAAYSCLKYTENNEEKEMCIRGGDPKYYGSYDNMSNNTGITNVSSKHPKGNIALISGVIGYLNSVSSPTDCSFFGNSTVCSNSAFLLSATSAGFTITSDVNIACKVDQFSYTYCTSSLVY